MSNLKIAFDPPNATEKSPLIVRAIFNTNSRNDSTDFTPVLENNPNIVYKISKSFRNPLYLLISGLAVGFTIVTIVVLSSGSHISESKILKASNSLTASQNDNSPESNYLVVETPLGKVKGNILQSREGRDYFSFYKVPYAQSPVGNLRFKSPEPAEKWEGTRDEKLVAPQCIQKVKYSSIIEAAGEEDCLYMNIYTPKLPSTNEQNDFLMPTLFYIHGGGFTDGNGSRYGGKYFMDENVVLITFQYRLGPFGFLSTEDGEITGNMGFKDQVMALRWVRDNVKYFGGDPNRVMIFGNSAGALSVSHLMVSPMANGLFHTAITQSGGSFCKSMFGSNQAKTTLASLAEEVGCSSRNQRRIIRCLRKIDAHDLAVVRTENITYNLIIEKYETDDSTDLFMPDTPYSIVQTGKANKVPWIVGVVSAEFVHTALDYLTDIELIDELNSNFTKSAPGLLTIVGPDAEPISQLVKDFYFQDKMIGNETLRNFSNLVSDRTIVHCSKVQAMMQAENSDVFLYYLSKEPEKSYADKAKVGFPPGNYGVAHADELQYIFDYYSYPEYPVNSTYYPFSRLLIKIWTQFAMTGKPYSENGIVWEKAKPGQSPISWFELNDNPQPTTVLQSRMEFWDQFAADDLNYI